MSKIAPWAPEIAYRGGALSIEAIPLALTGCGKKGAPQPPPGVPNTYPQNYPAQ